MVGPSARLGRIVLPGRDRPSGAGGRRVATGHLVSTVLTLVVIPLLYYALLQRMRPKEDAP